MFRLPILLVFIFSIFSGCGSKESVNSANTITVWHWMTDRDAAFQELAKRYEAKTGIKVVFELFAPSDSYSQKIRAAAQGNSLPDIFGVLGEKRDFGSFIKGGYVLDLTPYMQENNWQWKNRFFAKALAVNEFSPNNSYKVSPGIYAAPIDIMTIQLVYNKKLLRDLGYNKPPQDFQQLLEMGTKIRQTHLQGMVSGWGETWMIDCFANNYAFNIMGEKKFLATIRGEVPYTDPDWIKVLTLFKELRDSGVLANGIVTMINKNAEQLFANSKAVFAFNGSWCVNVYKGMNPNLDYGVILPPRASDKYPMSIWGGAGSSFMVNAQSKNKEGAVKFLKWLTDRDQQVYLAEATLGLPANKEAVAKLPEVLSGFAKGMEAATHPNTWEISEFSLVIEAFDKGIQSIIIGEKTPEQVAAEVQKTKEREIARRR